MEVCLKEFRLHTDSLETKIDDYLYRKMTIKLVDSEIMVFAKSTYFES